MTDCYEVLGEVRRPWVHAEALKERFLRLSAEAHPDRFHAAGEAGREEAGRRYTEINSAYQILSEPRQRLLHLIELETGGRPKDIQRIPPGTMDLFVEIGQACQSADAFLARRASVTSPMLKVALFREGIGWVETFKGLQAKVTARETAWQGELRELNGAWEQALPAGHAGRAAGLPMVRLEEIYRGLSYGSRWTGQIQERLVQLATF